jgi:hypothetical protein
MRRVKLIFTENLQKKQKFIWEDRTYICACVTLAHGQVYVETTTGTMIRFPERCCTSGELKLRIKSKLKSPRRSSKPRLRGRLQKKTKKVEITRA